MAAENMYVEMPASEADISSDGLASSNVETVVVPEQLELKASLAEQLLSLASMVEPGSSRWRGQLLLELQVAQVAFFSYFVLRDSAST